MSYRTVHPSSLNALLPMLTGPSRNTTEREVRVDREGEPGGNSEDP